MKILRLRFENINSLKGKQLIDFTQSPLCDTGIFAIVGPTGSGKSTILDAITLALYNQTPRTGSLSKNAIENYGSIITKHTTSCMAEVEYEVNGQQYRSKWEISRARTGTLRDYHMEIATLPNDEIVDVKKRDVPDKNAEIIGLNYSQFVKSILLSQGEFSKFLKANSSERGELLEKITGTEIYRTISKAAFERQKKEKIVLEKDTSILDAIQLIPEEELVEKKTKKAATENETEALKITIDNYNKHYQIKKSIEKYAQDITELTDNKEKAKLNIENYRPELKKIEKHNKLIAIKSDIDSFISKENAILKQNEKLAALQKKYELLTSEIETLNTKLKQHQTKKEATRTKTEKLAPILEEVKAIDAKINHYQLQQKDKTLIKNNVVAKIQQQQKEIAAVEVNINKNATLKSKLDVWMDKNEILKQLSGELSLINDKAQQAEKKSTATLAAINKELEQAEKAKLQNLNGWNNKLDAAKIIAAEKEAQKTKLAETLCYDLNEINEIKDRRENLLTKYTDIKSLIDLSKQYALAMQEVEKIKINLQMQEGVVTTKRTENIELNQQLEVQNKYKEELDIRIQRQQLEAKYKTDRKKLKADEACFLCGSRQHPYVQNYVDELDETKLKLIATQECLEAIKKQLQKNALDITKAETEQQKDKTQHNSLNDKLKKLYNDYTRVVEKHALKLKINEDVAIIEHLKEIEKEGVELKKQINAIEKINSMDNEIKTIKTIIANIEETIIIAEDLKKYTNKYAAYLTNTDSESEYLSILSKKASDYAKSEKKIVEVDKSLLGDRQLIEEKQINLKNSYSEEKNISEQLNEVIAEIQKYQKVRFEKLGNDRVEEVEQNLRKEMDSINTEIAKCEKNTASTSSLLQSELANMEETKQLIKETDLEIGKTKELLFPILEKLECKSPNDALSYILYEAEVNKIKDKEKRLEKEYIAVKQSLKDKQQSLIHLKEDEEQLETSNELSSKDLDVKMQEYRNVLQAKNRELGTLKTQIDENNNRINRSKELIIKIEAQQKEFDKWDRLNKLIGDATGTKFSKFAQELTLNQLILLANDHLKTLNDRYEITKGDSNVKDDLVICDHYQGGSSRSVRTLSGGESFLVSMALALGLSDLAGSNTQIESLFIDEGFGSLDQNTLDAALSSLEKLQAETNRTIGIISHVESLKERIKTQIVLTKSNSGYSSIKVCDN